ncbi:hypothetical protein X777_13683 [Ooceraea biroi]|uniref:Uncharacterized protein n=1 Tax=Ooceraea biroi TaxID=2015173 RepID=A0A026VY25_OOCBI|nr:hypothetical protein X777_13683 [Ooceraea biroi]
MKGKTWGKVGASCYVTRTETYKTHGVFIHLSRLCSNFEKPGEYGNGIFA